MKRLSLYYFYNKNGWVGDYVPYYLNKLKEFSEEIYVITSDKLSEEGRKKLQQCSHLIEEKNITSEIEAYKHAIETLSYKKIEEFDELILTNFSCYGPIYPLSEMFEKMEQQECDFWSLNKFSVEDEKIEKEKILTITEDIQSTFFVFKSPILKNDLFKKYWNESTSFSDKNCIQFFKEQSFSFSTYMDSKKYDEYELNPSIFNADIQNINDKNPIVNRNLFISENRTWVCHFIGHTAKDVFEYIDKNTEYDIGLIWQDLIKNQKMSVLRNNLHLNYYLSKKDSFKQNNSSTALILFVYYDDLVDYCINYMKSMPEGSDIYIISAKDEMLELYKKSTTDLKYNFIYRKMENVGRDVSAYLVAAADVYEKYDYICCMHDKKSKHYTYKKTGEDFNYHCFENCLASKEFVKNVIATFKENPYLGMLVPPMINYGRFYSTLEYSVESCLKPMLELYKFLNLEIPFDEYPEAPLGTMFWVRGKAFKSVFNHKWEYSDFPEEPIPLDGTLLHAMERVYPLCTQNDGYYVGWLATIDYINAYADNMFFAIKEINKIAFPQNFTVLSDYISRLPNYMTIQKVNSFSAYKILAQKILLNFTFGKRRKKLKEKIPKLYKSPNDIF